APSGTEVNNIVIFEVEIALKDRLPFFKPEMTANADILVDMATDVIKIPLEAIKGNSENKKVTLLKENPNFVPPEEKVEEGESEETKQKEDVAEDDPSEDYYKTEFELKRKYEESETKVVTGISNELWTEVVEGVTEGVVLKLPELKLPERREDFF
ncbi:MAG: hypothetical protein KC940_13170, partial [Candidatus Omnitrophica bacterium]|nr:hypothetical protein [Candidatus Omnitrophota bacterium]